MTHDGECLIEDDTTTKGIEWGEGGKTEHNDQDTGVHRWICFGAEDGLREGARDEVFGCQGWISI
jgi:hypothetical protein